MKKVFVVARNGEFPLDHEVWSEVIGVFHSMEDAQSVVSAFENGVIKDDFNGGLISYSILDIQLFKNVEDFLQFCPNIRKSP